MNPKDIEMPPFRKAGFIEMEKSKQLGMNAYFWDIETTVIPKDQEGNIEFKLCVIKHILFNKEGEIKKRQEFTCYNHAQFERFVYNELVDMGDKTLIAHNTGFDILHSKILDILMKHGYKIGIYFSKMSVSIITLEKKGSKITFLDTLNWYKESLESLGKRTKLPKMKIDFENCTELELSIYCDNDVEIMVHAFSQYSQWLWKRYNLTPKFTFAGDTYRAYRSIMKEKTLYRHNIKRALACEFNSYFGGRTEMFRKGDLSNETWYYVDVNSLYPFVMQNDLYSGELLKDRHKNLLDNIFEKDNEFNALAKIDVDIKEPYLPFRTETKTVFPVGKWTGWFCGNELKEILSSGNYTRIHETYYYDRCVDFVDYIRGLYKERLEAKSNKDELNSYFLKLMMNSLYGKFAQRNESLIFLQEGSKVRYFSDMETKTEAQFTKGIRQIGNSVYKVINNVIGSYSCPIVSSEITSNARFHLWKLMLKAGRENIAYCDTDSLFVNETGFNNLKEEMNDLELGKLKLEGKSNDLQIFGVKDYIFKKGRRLKAFNPKVDTLEGNKIKGQRFRSLTQHLSGMFEGKPNVYLREAELSRIYDKCAYIDKKSYTPFQADHIEQIERFNMDAYLEKAQSRKPETPE